MKQKGFTLIELLTVIALLAVIAGITFPIIQDALKTSKEKAYQEQVDTLKNATERWGTDNLKSLPTENNKCVCKSISDLQTDGYLTSTKEIKDPRDNQIMSGSVKITYDATHKQYKYDYVTSCTC